ncbi:MAG: MltA domain-containing protein, partial [Burkholderiaceae bacterium]|nr:MltA domain-containing protein [Burkholderiaceae bacterium]
MLLALALWGAGQQARAGSESLRPDALAGWHDDDLAGLDAAIGGQCRLARPPPPWPRLCVEWRAAAGRTKQWIATRFEARALSGARGEPTGLVTGYYEPVIDGSRLRSSPQQVALHRRPSEDLLRERPTRAAIEDSDLLAGRELVWIDDPVEAFFLHVQGSGRVRLGDGSTMRVGYAANNGRPYRAIGRVLIDRGALDTSQADTAGIKRWLRENPDKAREVMQANPRYIFFRELPGADAVSGPPGSLGVALTPMRSVAIDPTRIAPGSLLFLHTEHPADRRPLRRVVIAQDTGGAIAGPIRIDLFWGRGEAAGDAAGRMR